MIKTCTAAAVVRIVIGIAMIVGGCSLLPRLFCAFRTISPLPSAVAEFQARTGITVEPGWQIIESGKRRNGMGEGETWVVLHLPDAAIGQLLESKPAWSREWKPGPVPGEIGFNCGFGRQRVAYSPAAKPGASDYSGDGALITLLGSASISYDAQERDSEWENGSLLIVDRTAGKVWLSVWDF